MKRMTNRWSPLAAAAGAMLSLSAWADAIVTDGVLVIDVQSGSENSGDPDCCARSAGGLSCGL